MVKPLTWKEMAIWSVVHAKGDFETSILSKKVFYIIKDIKKLLKVAPLHALFFAIFSPLLSSYLLSGVDQWQQDPVTPNALKQERMANVVTFLVSGSHFPSNRRI